MGPLSEGDCFAVRAFWSGVRDVCASEIRPGGRKAPADLFVGVPLCALAKIPRQPKHGPVVDAPDWHNEITCINICADADGASEDEDCDVSGPPIQWHLQGVSVENEFLEEHRRAEQCRDRDRSTLTATLFA